MVKLVSTYYIVIKYIFIGIKIIKFYQLKMCLLRYFQAIAMNDKEINKNFIALKN